MNKNHFYKWRLSEADRVLFQGAANIAGMSLAEWLRMVARQEARRVAEMQGRETEDDRR
jgi:hypothetical protein